jgi:hypothetical protein
MTLIDMQYYLQQAHMAKAPADWLLAHCGSKYCKRMLTGGESSNPDEVNAAEKRTQNGGIDGGVH